ncbi:hypothetical protein AJ79_03686 [Helicocarpus griseus UAMH5409]|uniref:Uncharacterized protein n=1 Tax=Helicocarpus griseus UAMH5409 TaxID=1447875 RepID=A0A2B7XY54_9EURO|nr:hypothetical protein AJ79_03686 [Helicocarpus griseus UAMH5409]
MVYSLICQLLRLMPPEDMRVLCPEMKNKLTTLNIENWKTALDLLKSLLESTPSLQYCVIHGVNTLESGTGDMLKEFLQIILAHVKNSSTPLRLLLATSGHSRTLDSLVTGVESKALMEQTLKHMRTREQFLDSKMFE